MKIYGNTNTNLELSAIAQAVYNDTDPLKIIENEDGTYSMKGIEDRDGLTAEQVNGILEAYYVPEVTEEAQEIVDNGLYNAAVALMDDEIREELHNLLAPCSDEQFLSAYMEAHRAKYGADFTI